MLATKLADNSIHAGHGYLHGMTLRNMSNPVVFRIIYMISFFHRMCIKFKTERTKIAPICDGLYSLYIHISHMWDVVVAWTMFVHFLVSLLFYFFFLFPTSSFSLRSLFLSYSPDLDACVFDWLAGWPVQYTHTVYTIHVCSFLLWRDWLFSD